MKKSILIMLVILVSGLVAVSHAQTDGKTETMTDETATTETTLTLINPFEVPADKLDEVILMWEQARDFLQKQPGYISTALHQSVAPDAKYRLINIAKWENAETFRAATQKMRAEGNIPRIEGVTGGPQLYTVVRRD